ncbi:MAG: serine hydrolase domain-containing protein [Bacteroidota bacterium]
MFDLASESTPGCMLGIMQGDTFLYTQGYGSANLEYKIPIHIHSSFNIASLSKQFTAACIALLILEGKVSLDDDLKAFIPDFPEYEYDIKIKHLIYMTSGINDYYYNPRSNGTDWSSLHFFNIDTAIAASLSNESLMYEPGTQWSYSNINYMLLTKVVEQVSGMPFSVFARQRLFLPLEMNDTYVNDDIFQIIPNRVTGYNFRDAENTDWMIESGYLQRAGDGFLQINRHSPHYGGSGVYTTVSDLGKWMANFETKSFGGNAFYDLIHTTMRFAHDKTNDAFGLAFGDFNGEPIVFYAGGDWGFSSYFMRFPELGLSIVCLANLGTANTRQYVNSVVDILVGEGIIEW